MAKSRQFYTIMTDNSELAKLLWEVLDKYKTYRWWKKTIKYYLGNDPKPYYETSEGSGPAD